MKILFDGTACSKSIELYPVMSNFFYVEGVVRRYWFGLGKISHFVRDDIAYHSKSFGGTQDELRDESLHVTMADWNYAFVRQIFAWRGILRFAAGLWHQFSFNRDSSIRLRENTRWFH